MNGTTSNVRRNFSFALVSILMMGCGSLRLCAQSIAPDPTFNPGTGADLDVYSIALQTNGQILIAGDFFSFDDIERINVARLNADGSRDDSFNPGDAMGGDFPYVNAVALQSGGMVLVGGNFTNVAAANFARLNTNGVLDTNFTTLTDDDVNAIAVQTNGSILIGGYFTKVNGRARSGIARLDSSGALDLGFNPIVQGGGSVVYALALQADGKIIIGGSFTKIGGSMRTNIARLNADGSPDSNFKVDSMDGGGLAPTVPGIIYALALDGQGRVLAGGNFTLVNGLVRSNLARFTGDGSLDTNFNAAAGTDLPVNSLVIQSDGKILLGGSFNLVKGATNNYLARLNSDGSLDATFNAGFGVDDSVYAFALQPDDKVLIGGGFTEFNGTSSAGIARLQNVSPDSLPQLLNPSFSHNVFGVSVATVAGKSYSLQFKNALSDSTWTSLPAVAGDGTIKTLSDGSATVPRRFYRVELQ